MSFLLDWKRVFTYRVYKIQALEALLSIHEYLLSTPGTTSYRVFHTSSLHKSQRNQPTLNHVGEQRVTLHCEINFALEST